MIIIVVVVGVFEYTIPKKVRERNGWGFLGGELPPGVQPLNVCGTRKTV